MDGEIVRKSPKASKAVPRPGQGLQAWTIRVLKAAQSVHAKRIRLQPGDPRRERLERAGRILLQMVAAGEGRR